MLPCNVMQLGRNLGMLIFTGCRSWQNIKHHVQQAVTCSSTGESLPEQLQLLAVGETAMQT